MRNQGWWNGDIVARLGKLGVVMDRSFDGTPMIHGMLLEPHPSARLLVRVKGVDSWENADGWAVLGTPYNQHDLLWSALSGYPADQQRLVELIGQLGVEARHAMHRAHERLTPDPVLELEDGDLFVFGSNLSGIHGGGAAKAAHTKWGAAWGVGEGLTGRCYALPTKGINIAEMPLPEVLAHCDKFVRWYLDRWKRPQFKRIVLTKVGCGLAGFTPAEIAPAFKTLLHAHEIHMPPEFFDELLKSPFNTQQ